MRSRKTLTPILAGLLGLLVTAAPAAHGQDTVTPVDLGLLRDSELSVVQKRLYSMEKRSELGVHVGLMPFDAYTVAPFARGSFTLHRTESFGLEVAAGAGYGFKNSAYRELEGPAYGIAAEAYRYLGQVGVGIEYSPAYAKLNWRGKRVYHHNFYVLGGAGLTVEQSVLPAADLAMGPGGSLGVGLRVFHGKAGSIRLELRDDIFVQSRAQTATTALKQNVSLSVGLSRFGKER
jgi:outer membrane beta-barrel protein